MDINTIGSVNSYVKNSAMLQKWQAKQKNGDFSADGSRTIGEWIESQTKKNNAPTNSADMDDRSDNKLAGIRSKLANGHKLDLNERKYLKEKDPVTYQKLEEAEAEDKKFREELKKCKTKDEVQRLKFSRLSVSLGTVKSVESNPNIPKEVKLGIIAGEQAKTKMINESADKFARSGRYSELPTDAEKREAKKLLKEAKEAELQHEHKEISEAAAVGKNGTAEGLFPEPEKNADGAKRSGIADVKEKVEISNASENAKIAASDKKTSKIKAELSPEVRKVKRSKIPYNRNDDEGNGGDITGMTGFEVKA